MNRVVHFEISADEPERAIQFYKDLFGWKITSWPGPQDYWLIETGPADQPGINGGLFRRGGPVNYVNTIEVANLDDMITRIEARGGKLALPKQAIPGVGWLAYFQDTEGNVFGVTQTDPNAK